MVGTETLKSWKVRSPEKFAEEDRWTVGFCPPSLYNNTVYFNDVSEAFRFVRALVDSGAKLV